MPHQQLLTAFKNYDINFEIHNHAPVFTAEEARNMQYDIRGAHCKNLFLRDKKRNFFLVSVLDNKRVDLKALSKNFGAGHFSFGNADELLSMLGVTPGSVTPYGLIHDKDKKITFLIDQDILGYEFVNFHPLRNDMTVNSCVKQFLKFFDKIGHQPEAISIPLVDLGREL
jgi:Ala-tRNA(Pro) deacylase